MKYLCSGKNSKVLYYARGFLFYLTPKLLPRMRLKQLLREVENREDKASILERVDYYCQLEGMKPFTAYPAGETPHVRLGDFKLAHQRSTYFFDTFEYTRWFSPRYQMYYVFGDVTRTPGVPAIVKSRPIAKNPATSLSQVEDNRNSVLLNLDKVRHFVFLHDRKRFTEKENILFFRADLWQKEHRLRFMELYFNHPLCNLGEVTVTRVCNPEWIKAKIPLKAHLKYKFILALEGNDVASNLKWIMSSHSIAVMPKPKYETWFMEGKLLPNVHYIEIKEDYSNLEEQLKYYIEHPEKAESIIRNANAYVNQFKNKKREKLISLLVLEKYFSATGQNRSL